jgi:erythromycin esterase-like protein
VTDTRDIVDIVERLRAFAADEADRDDCSFGSLDAFHAAADEIERLRARIVELEATLAATMGTLAPRHSERAIEPFSIEHNVPGNAPV